MDVQGPEPGRFESEKQGRSGGQAGRRENESGLAPLVDDLCQILQELTDTHEKALQLAEEKQELLIENDIEGLSEVVEQEEKIMQRIERLEKERSSLADELAELTGQEDLNISALREHVSGERQRRLKELQEELRPLLEKLGRVNEQNRQLLLQAMKFNEVSLKLFMQGADNNSTYSAEGENVKREEKQSRNIIDRRA